MELQPGAVRGMRGADRGNIKQARGVFNHTGLSRKVLSEPEVLGEPESS